MCSFAAGLEQSIRAAMLSARGNHFGPDVDSMLDSAATAAKYLGAIDPMATSGAAHHQGNGGITTIPGRLTYLAARDIYHVAPGTWVGTPIKK